eukprot:308549-Rhodomonas_salina.2
MERHGVLFLRLIAHSLRRRIAEAGATADAHGVGGRLECGLASRAWRYAMWRGGCGIVRLRCVRLRASATTLRST